jgi:leader peptidase (prepilin peptidase)/N-methyltransferase
MTDLEAIIFGVVGLPVGSFLTVVITRIPAKESIVAPRSRCPSCGNSIRNKDNVPVVSWLLLKGRCRNCDLRISPIYPLTEATTSALFVASSLAFHDFWVAIMMALFLTLMLAVAIIDWHRKIIPNAIVYPSLVAFCMYILAASIAGAPLDFVGAAIGFAAYGGVLLLVAVVSPTGMGMGDVKLVALIGLVLGSVSLASVLVAAGAGILLGGIGAIGALLSGASRKHAIPFGPFLAAGAVIGALWGPELANLYRDLLL